MVNFDKPAVIFPVKSWIFPEFKVEVVEEFKDGSKIIVDEMGIKKRIGKENDSIPEYYEWPVKNRDFPLMMGGEVGFFGPLRYLLGEIRSDCSPLEPSVKSGKR